MELIWVGSPEKCDLCGETYPMCWIDYDGVRFACAACNCNYEPPMAEQPQDPIVKGQLDALAYVLTVIESKRAIRRTADYAAALADIELHVNAAKERLENGEDIHSYAYTQSPTNKQSGDSCGNLKDVATS